MNAGQLTEQLRELTAAAAGLAEVAENAKAAVVGPAAGLSGLAAASNAGLGEWLRVLQQACDVLQVARVDALAEFGRRQAHLDEGAPTAAVWAVRELRVPSAEAKRWIKAAATMRTLPEVGAAARAGEIRLEHVAEFTGALTRTGVEIITAAQDPLLTVAKSCDPAELRAVAKELDDVVTPERLDDAYRDGMDKSDFQVSRVGDGADAGYAVTGWLDPVSGAKLKAWLDAASSPRGDDDVRAPSQRRVDAVRELIDSVLDNGLPHDNGFRPQIYVTVELDTLLGHSRDSSSSGRHHDNSGHDSRHHGSTDKAYGGRGSWAGSGSGTGGGPEPGLPARLGGFGSIGADLLDYLRCDADLTPVLVQHPGLLGSPPGRDSGSGAGDSGEGGGDDPSRFPDPTSASFPQARVLNVGRTQRRATPKQRIAIRIRQAGTCANPGCQATHIEAHHVAWWLDHHGPTDLDNLVGMCSRCHHLVHQHKLAITPDGAGGFVFTDSCGSRLADHRRNLVRTFHHRLCQALRSLGGNRPSAQRPAA